MRFQNYQFKLFWRSVYFFKPSYHSAQSKSCMIRTVPLQHVPSYSPVRIPNARSTQHVLRNKCSLERLLYTISPN